MVKINKPLTNNPGKATPSLSEFSLPVTIDSASVGIITTTKAPKTTVLRLYSPVTTAPVRINKERLSGKALGVAALIETASNAPERPEIPDEIENAIILYFCRI